MPECYYDYCNYCCLRNICNDKELGEKLGWGPCSNPGGSEEEDDSEEQTDSSDQLS
jgi:hypothetical protein